MPTSGLCRLCQRPFRTVSPGPAGVLQWIHARKKKLRVLFPPICLSRAGRLPMNETIRSPGRQEPILPLAFHSLPLVQPCRVAKRLLFFWCDSLVFGSMYSFLPPWGYRARSGQSRIGPKVAPSRPKTAWFFEVSGFFQLV